MLKSATDNSFNYHAVSASDNPQILSGELAHGGVALMWKYSLDDLFAPLITLSLIVSWELNVNLIDVDHYLF